MKTNSKKYAPVWPDDPRSGKVIDDNAFYLLSLIARRLLANAGTDSFVLTARTPIEWNQKDTLEFLLQVSKEYNFKLTNFSVMIYAFAEDYEVPIWDNKGRIDPAYKEEWATYQEKNKEYEKCVEENRLKKGYVFNCLNKYSIPPKKYIGAYKWALERVSKPKSDIDKLLKKVFDNKLETQDLEELIRLSRLPIPNGEPSNSDLFYAHTICNSIIDWVSFDVDPGEEVSERMQNDLRIYLDKFINEQLNKKNYGKRLNGTGVALNSNIFTFEKHSKILIECFQRMTKDFGDEFTFADPFDEGLEAVTPEIIRKRFSARQFLFMHSLFAFVRLGYINIKSLGTNWDFYEDKPLKYDVAVQVLPPLKELINNGHVKQGLWFDTDKSRLYFRGLEIKIAKLREQYHALRIIFENESELYKEWFFSEIAERVDKHNPNEKRYYNAFYQIRQKLDRIGYPDFFIATRHSVKINPKYES